MVKKKLSGRVAPKTASATALAASSQTSTPHKSSVLKSAFSPFSLQLSLFASVIQSLDSQRLRIHDTVSGRLKSEFTPSHTHINCITWGYYKSTEGLADSEPAKKKRRKQNGAGAPGKDPAAAVVAVGTNSDGIDLFSPLESKVVGTLAPAHRYGTRDFRFRDLGVGSEAWSLGADGTLIQWNLGNRERVRTIRAPAESIGTFTFLRTSLLAASHSSFIIDPESEQTTATFPGYKDPIHSLIVSPQAQLDSGSALFLAAAQASRYVNVYNTNTTALLGNLIAESEVEQLAFNEDVSQGGYEKRQQPLALVTKDGKLNVFRDAFEGWESRNSKQMDLKTRLKQATRKPEAIVQIIRPDKTATQVSILNVSFQDAELVLALADGAAELNFERIPWRDERGGLSLSGFVQRTKTKSSDFTTEITNGVKDHRGAHVDEAGAVVALGTDVRDVDPSPGTQDVIEISSAEEDSDESDADSEAEPLDHEPTTNGMVNEDADMTDMGEEEKPKEQDSDGGEPSFGEMIRAKAIGTVDVAAAFPPADEQNVVPTSNNLRITSNLSMGNALSQALRTNDASLLNTCLQYEDLQIVRATIERLSSDLAMTLLQRLAERLHSRPGRAGSLLVWVQWTLVAHGGYLAARPDVVKQLSSLHTSVQERAQSLQALLSLKGKLDMLEAQINLRRSLQRHNDPSSGQEKAGAPVVYVEGQDESSSDSENEPLSLAASEQRSAGDLVEHSSGEEAESDPDAENAMDVDEEEALDEDSEDDSLIDDMASESGSSHDEDAEDEIDYDDVDDSAEDEGEEKTSATADSQSKEVKMKGIGKGKGGR